MSCGNWYLLIYFNIPNKIKVENSKITIDI